MLVKEIIMAKARQGADKIQLLIYPFVFMAVLVLFFALVWAFVTYVAPLFA
jgi:hypothetical protein